MFAGIIPSGRPSGCPPHLIQSTKICNVTLCQFSQPTTDYSLAVSVTLSLWDYVGPAFRSRTYNKLPDGFDSRIPTNGCNRIKFSCVAAATDRNNM